MGDFSLGQAPLQAENELAAQRIKSMQLQHKQELEAAREEAARLQQQLAAQATALPATPQAGIEAGRLQQILSLESQLEALRVAGEEREAELRQQLAAVKSEKRELEGRLEQLDVHSTQVSYDRGCVHACMGPQQAGNRALAHKCSREDHPVRHW